MTTAKAAREADMRSRRCTGCSFRPCLAIPAVYTACTKAFLDGFAKGARYARRKKRER